jgi:hypothetical protein
VVAECRATAAMVFWIVLISLTTGWRWRWRPSTKRCMKHHHERSWPRSPVRRRRHQPWGAPLARRVSCLGLAVRIDVTGTAPGRVARSHPFHPTQPRTSRGLSTGGYRHCAVRSGARQPVVAYLWLAAWSIPSVPSRYWPPPVISAAPRTSNDTIGPSAGYLGLCYVALTGPDVIALAGDARGPARARVPLSEPAIRTTQRSCTGGCNRRRRRLQTNW